jgi:hypothetical protein
MKYETVIKDHEKRNNQKNQVQIFKETMEKDPKLMVH